MARPDRPGSAACRLLPLFWIMAALCLLVSEASATTLTFTVNASEPVTVTGTPRIAIDVGGLTRYASYASGSGSSALTFGYQVQAGDFDADGISLVSPIDLNGGSITDLSGNPASSLGFALPDTTGLRVQTYTAAFTSTASPAAIGFAIAKAPAGASFSYTITSSGGTGSLTGSGTITASPQSVSGVDVSALATGTLTLSVTVSNASGTGAARTDSFTPALTGALDSLPAAAASYSVRRLRAAYAGPLLRVRRASDSAERDIAGTIGGDLDTATLAAFCGSDTCSVSTWYDQSGNGRDAVQATWQPQLVTAGTIERLGTRPAVRFFNNASLAAPAALANANEYTVAITAVERQRSAGSFTWRLQANTAGNPRVLASMPWPVDGVLYYDQGSYLGTYRIYRAWPVAIGTPAVATFQNSASAGTRSVYLNGALFLSGTGYAAASDTVAIGQSYGGHIAEFILFGSVIASTDRQALERSEGDYFGVAVP